MRAIWFGVALALAACGGTPSKTQPAAPAPPAAPPPAAPPPADDAGPSVVAKMQELSDAMCRCVDKQCADQLVAQLTQWGEDEAKADRGRKISPEDAKRVSDIADVITQCMTKAVLATP